MTTRLTDMKVEEISLVRRAANKKRFVLVKADGTETDDLDLIPREGGGFALVPVGEGQSVRKDIVQIPKGMRDGLLKDASGALERLVALTRSIKDAEEVDGGTVPDAMVKEMGEIADLLKAGIMDCPKCGYTGPAKGEGLCPKCGEKMAAHKKASKTTKQGQSLHAQLFTERVGALKKIADDLEAKGADMPSEERRSKLGELHSIAYGLDEFASVVALTKSQDDEQALKEAEARGEVRGMNAAIGNLLKMLPGGVAPTASLPENAGINAGSGSVANPDQYPIMDAAAMLGKVPGMAPLLKSIEDLTEQVRVAKEQAKAAEERARLAKEAEDRARSAVGMPTSGRADGAPAPKAKEGWPRDLNRPPKS